MSVETAAVIGVLLIFLALAVPNAFAVVPYAPVDEVAHAAYAMELAHGRLPAIADKIDNAALGTAHRHPKGNIQRAAKHPPLYYAMIAPAIRWGAETGHPASGLYLARLISVLIAAVGVVYVHRTARVLFPRRPGIAVLAALLWVVVPRFVYVSSVVHNDGLAITALAGLAHATVACVMLSPTRRRVATWVVWGTLGLLSRFSVALAVVPAAGALFLSLLLQPGTLGVRTRRALAWTAVACGVVACAGGWFYLHNVLATGDLSGTARLLHKYRTPHGSFVAHVSNASLWLELYQTAWDRYTGGKSIGGAIRLIPNALALFSLAGLVWSAFRGIRLHRSRLLRSRALWGLGVLTLLCAAVVLPIFEYYARGGSFTSRYALPGLWIVLLVFAVGACAPRASLFAESLAATLVLYRFSVLGLAVRLFSELAAQGVSRTRGGEYVVPAWATLWIVSSVAVGTVLALRGLHALYRADQPQAPIHTEPRSCSTYASEASA